MCSVLTAHMCMPDAGSTDCITEHCVEIARVKHAGQAAFLVGKLKKYREMLPEAEANLQKILGCLTQHPPEQRLAFVLRMRVALKAHAKGASRYVAPAVGCLMCNHLF